MHLFDQSYSCKFVFKVGDAVVLCVGAGGICCELLKTLAVSGITRIELVRTQSHENIEHRGRSLRVQIAQVDPDTVEAGSFGWQLFFRERHVGRSKAVVAAEALHSLRPLVDIKAWHMDIRDASFGVDFFRRFNLVVSTVDNVEDKRHVNRLCLAANVPLISAGASAYNGQVRVSLLPASPWHSCTPEAQFLQCTVLRKLHPSGLRQPVKASHNVPPSQQRCILDIVSGEV
jgi:ubiquitin-like 1-activating enzyme E1 B